MTIDISSHLRRLVMAGLPLLGAACAQGDPTGRNPDQVGPTPLVVVPSCEVRQVFSSTNPANLMVNVGFDRNDLRFSDLFKACTEDSLHCHRLCIELVNHSKPKMYYGAGIGGCELGCDPGGGAVATIRYSNAVPGRRPESVSGGVPTAPGTSLAAFWGACAGFEGASVAAFATLADELRLLGAPAALVDRALAARADELEHFAVTRQLAIGHGADPAALALPVVGRGPAPRSLEAVALENATEGCVGETFAAAVALWQSSAARSAQVRAALAEIASEELAHAQLAWDVDAWIGERIDAAARRRLDQARAAAGERLVAASASPVDPGLVREAGLPDAGAAVRLAASARLVLWS